MKTLEIDQLKIRLRGVSPENVRACSADLGRELLLRFRAQNDFLQKMNGKRINNIDAGVAEVTKGAQPSDLLEIIANRTAEAIGFIKNK